jgi:benzoate/toluate 1,2-dioxygenase reductase component
MLTSTKVTLAFTDGVEHELAVEPGQTVLDAAVAAELPVFFQCRSGSCSTCMATLVEGEAGTRAGASSTLLASEREEGKRLLCITEPKGECRFELGYDSAAGAGKPIEAKAFVNAIDRIASDVVRLELELAEGFWMDFKPGQFVQVSVPGTGEVRSYSMSSTPEDMPKIELLIRILPGGVMSDWLVNRAKVDDVLDVSGPYGSFFLREKVKAPHIMIAGGTGLAPMMSMIDTLRAAPGRKPKTLLSFGCQNAAGLFHMDALELRGHWMPTLDVRVCVEAGDGPDGTHASNPVAVIGKDETLDPESVAYLCGPPGMIEAARRHLEALGLDPANIHAEQFTASGS